MRYKGMGIKSYQGAVGFFECSKVGDGDNSLLHTVTMSYSLRVDYLHFFKSSNFSVYL